MCPKCGKDYRQVSFSKFHDHVRCHYGVYECQHCNGAGPRVNYGDLDGRNNHLAAEHPQMGIPCPEPCTFVAKVLREYNSHMSKAHGHLSNIKPELLQT